MYDRMQHLNALKQMKMSINQKTYNSLVAYGCKNLFTPLSFHIRRKQVFIAHLLPLLFILWNTESVSVLLLRYRKELGVHQSHSRCLSVFTLYWTFCFSSYLCVLSPDDIKDEAFCRLFMDPQQSALDPQQQARPKPNPLGSIKKR